MPSPGSGSANSITAPTAPTEALDADDADPGVVEATKAAERAAQTGKYGSVQADTFKPPTDEDPATPQDSAQEQEKSWIEIKLVDEDNRPVAGESFQITLPNNEVSGGMTDADGVGRVEGFDPGNCQVTFPELDKSVWQDK